MKEFDDVKAELDRAVAKFPTWPTDPLHAVAVPVLRITSQHGNCGR